MGADSWMDITTWREWDKVLALSNHIVVTRPGVEIGFSHIADDIKRRTIDLRGQAPFAGRSDNEQRTNDEEPRIFITDAVSLDISATEIRQKIRDNVTTWREDVPAEVANYIEKYQIYN